MTIRPYALTTDPSNLTQGTENPLSTLAEDDGYLAKKLCVESSKIEQIASVILETHPNLESDTRLNCLNGYQSIEPLSHQSDREKKSLIKVINEGSNEGNDYCHLAKLLEECETIELLNGEIYTKKELFLKAIQLKPKDADLYNSLAICLKDDETLQLLSGGSYTKKELYLKAIQLNPQSEHAYYNLASCLKNGETVQLLDGEIYTKKELLLKATECNPKHASSYYNLAGCLKNGETIQLLDGKVYTNKELLLKTIQCNPQHANAYHRLVSCLKEHEKIQFFNGVFYTKKGLYLRAIHSNPKNETYYQNLANLLKNHESIQLLSGEVYTKRTLYLQAIELNPQDETYYQRLANLLKDDESIQLLRGEIYTKKELYLKDIQLHPQHASTYCKLGDLLKGNESIQLLGKEVYTKKDFYHKAIDLGSVERISSQARQYLKHIYIHEIEKNPNSIEGYFNLILIIQNETILFKNGERADRESLFKKAFALDPIHVFSSPFAPAVFSVASSLHSKTESLIKELISHLTLENELARVQLLRQGVSLTLNEKTVSTKALYQQALSFLSSTYLKQKGDEGVGDYLSSRKSILLQDGVKFTKLMAYAYAYEQSQRHSILMKIGDALHPEERILLKGDFYDKRACYEKGSSNWMYDTSYLRQAEALYPHEQAKKRDLFHQALDLAYSLPRHSLETSTMLARILSQYELTGLGSQYLTIFKEELQHHQSDRKNRMHGMNDSSQHASSLVMEEDLYFTQKEEFLLELLKHVPSCEEAYVALATSFQHTLRIHEESYASKEALYLKAIDLNPEYSLPYFLLGKELFYQKIESILLLNGVTLSCKQLFMRSIQLGTYEAGAYHLAALMMHDREGILLFDEKTILSRGDLFIRAFELDFTRVNDLKNFLSYVKRRKESQLNV
ncbi:MAG: hypothetical protein QRY71_00845 [Candidatus Rhabdochlamydia sp.]